MKKLIPFLFILSLQAQAAISLSAGQLILNQRNNMMTDEPQAGFDFSARYAWDRYQLGLEFFQFATSQTGNTTLQSYTSSSGLQLSGQYSILTQKVIRPYLAVGVGLEQINTQLKVYGSHTEDTSKPYWLMHAGGGIRFQLMNEFHIATEGRLNFGEIRDPNPAWSFLINVGVDLN